MIPQTRSSQRTLTELAVCHGSEVALVRRAAMAAMAQRNAHRRSWGGTKRGIWPTNNGGIDIYIYRDIMAIDYRSRWRNIGKQGLIEQTPSFTPCCIKSPHVDTCCSCFWQ